MICPGAVEELNAFLDGESPVDRAAALARHLTECPACAAGLAELAQARLRLAEAVPPTEPSPALRARIEVLLAEAAARRPPASPRLRPLRDRFAAFGAGAIAAAAFAIAVVWFKPEDKTSELIAVRDAALRTELASATRGQAPAPRVEGFAVASTREDLIAGHRARVIVYRNDGSTVTLCLWPSGGEPARKARIADLRGVRIEYWNDGRNEFWAVSAAPAQTLHAFAASLGAT